MRQPSSLVEVIHAAIFCHTRSVPIRRETQATPCQDVEACYMSFPSRGGQARLFAVLR